MPHRRSKEAKAKRALRNDARKYVWDSSFRDFELSETVCCTTQAELDAEFPDCGVDLADVGKGLILVDSRGRGAFQT